MRKRREKGKLTVREAIVAILAAKGSATLDYLIEKTGYDRNLILVTISNMVKEGIITRGWMKYAGKKFRIYRLKGREELTK
ncbi:plasmid regulator [Saccharolobus shibatae]|uniref:Transcriptional regulator, wHTH n=1 Tax=Saccharolobus shibatae TaxID=2286 RepID=A0A8F5C422_9CREN|nr:plasmid regulator [Saccharolobus shibatae]QXJ36581.1 Transcriptional regulator, wHTH [Saccharolobus shibatae]